MCRQYGWTLDYVLSLPLPVFAEISSRRSQIFAETALKEVFPGVIAALSGGEYYRDLHSACGKVVVDRKLLFRPEAVERARRQAQKVADMIAAGELKLCDEP